MTDDPDLQHDNEVFGGCPECGRVTRVANIGRDHWAYCTDHRVAWCFGSNLLSSWQLETEEQWEKNRQFLSTFRTHDPNSDNGRAQRAAETDGPRLKLVAEGGCAVCNPAKARPHEEFQKEIRETFTLRLHAIQIAPGNYGLIEVPGSDGKAARFWGCSFASARAAGFARDNLVEAAANGNVNDALCSDGVAEHFNLVDRLLTCIEGRCGDATALAMTLATLRPWTEHHLDREDDDDFRIPF